VSRWIGQVDCVFATNRGGPRRLWRRTSNGDLKRIIAAVDEQNELKNFGTGWIVKPSSHGLEEGASVQDRVGSG
jgi:hypothetical protein